MLTSFNKTLVNLKNLIDFKTIISVSRLIGTMKLSISNEVLECLSLINHLSLSDQPYKVDIFGVLTSLYEVI